MDSNTNAMNFAGSGIVSIIGRRERIHSSEHDVGVTDAEGEAGTLATGSEDTGQIEAATGNALNEDPSYYYFVVCAITDSGPLGITKNVNCTSRGSLIRAEPALHEF